MTNGIDEDYYPDEGILIHCPNCGQWSEEICGTCNRCIYCCECCESCAGHEYDESEESLTCEGCGKALYLNGETLCSMCAEAGPLS